MRVSKPPKSIHFPEIEQKISELWESEKTFKRSIETRPESKKFRFYDGPPFATGLPHFGHFVPNSIKDALDLFLLVLLVMRRRW